MNEIIETTTANATATAFQANTFEVPQAVADHAVSKNRIQQLADNATRWNDTVYATSTDMLYGILQNCYGYYEAMCIGDEPAKQLRAELEQCYEERVGKFKKDDHTLVSIVKCVFGHTAKNRRRLSCYSIALRAAAEAKQKSADIAQL